MRFAQPGPSFGTLREECLQWLRDSVWLRGRLVVIGFSFEDAHDLAFGEPL